VAKLKMLLAKTKKKILDSVPNSLNVPSFILIIGVQGAANSFVN